MTSSPRRRARRLRLGLLVALASGCSDGGEPPIRHVVLISLDTTRADHLACYGNERVRTPSIDGLAREGVLFQDVTSTAPTTLAAHTSLMTGTYPHTHGVVRNGFMVHEDNVMLAELLREAGYHTAAVLGSFALERRFDFNQGFEHFDEEFELLLGEGGLDQNQRSAAGVTDAALAHVDEAQPEHLFLFAHYFDAHQPYTPPEAFARQYAQDGAPLRTGAEEVETAIGDHQEALIGARRGSSVVHAGLTPDLVAGATGAPLTADGPLVDLYAAEVSAMDAEIGRLLEGLDERGVLEDALVILTGDHGETFYEHADFWNHGLSVYQTTVSVPLVLRFPDGRSAGRKVPQPVSIVDLLPTLCELLALDVPARAEGTSLAALIDGRTLDRDPVFAEATQPGSRFEPKDGWRNREKSRCVRDGPWKYIVTPYLGLEELYHLERDPGEQRNLLRELPAPPDALEARARLSAELKRWARTAEGLPSRFNASQARETAERLKALGYIGDDTAEDE